MEDKDTAMTTETSFKVGREQGLREVAEWLDVHSTYRATIRSRGIELPFLDPMDYEKLYLALKEGKLPNLSIGLPGKSPSQGVRSGRPSRLIQRVDKSGQPDDS